MPEAICGEAALQRFAKILTESAMSLPHRIAAGAIVLKEEAIVLVRYRNEDGTSYLVAPGGAAQERESVADAAVREVL